MKSKPFDLPKNVSEKVKQNKTFDFVNYYKCAAENNVKLVEVRKSEDDGSKGGSAITNKLRKRERLSNKIKKDKSDTSLNIGVNSSCVLENSLLNNSKVTSTPNISKKDLKNKVKSIMKNKRLLDETPDTSENLVTTSKPKKRNKSVSFMLDDIEEIAIKRSKSEETVAAGKSDKVDIKNLVKTKKTKKIKIKSVSEKENRADTNNTDVKTLSSESNKTRVKHSQKLESLQPESSNITMNEMVANDINVKKKRNKYKKNKPTEKVEPEVESANRIEDNDNTVSNDNDNAKENRIKKLKSKKKKRDCKFMDTGITGEDEPIVKNAKKDLKPDVIAQGLENLNIGDNAHTLTNLLDDMTVVDKTKKKRQKNKEKNKHKQNKELQSNNECKGENVNIEEKEKVKWVKRKWNKDKKGGLSVDKYLTSIVIENLPLKIMCSYKKLLSEHFQKFGMIRYVGIAEVYPNEEPKPVFTTTINFYSEDAANKAFEEDNTAFEGNRIRIKKPLSPTLTTLVVHSYAELTEQSLSSVFAGAGRIRNIRHLMKGKKSSSTAFIEFDGPESVERAIKMADEAKIGGKRIHVAKFEIRDSNKKMRKNDD